MTSNSDPILSSLSASAEKFKQSFLGSSIMRKVILALVVVTSILLYSHYQSNDITTANQNQQNKQENSALNAISVVVAPVRDDNLNIYQFGLGSVTPLNVVDVSSRVDGQLIDIAFEEGQMVKAGDFLAQIDPTPFNVQLKLSTGQLALDQVLLNKAKIDLERYQLLLTQDSTSLQLVETKESLVRQYQAAVQADQGAVSSAEMQLKYARIIAPISGRLGFRQVDIGNIVRASDRQGIVTITQLDPISVIFPIPEDVLPRVMKMVTQGEDIPVELYDRGLKEKIAKGHLLAVDNQIDATTGTIKLKAEFANPDGQLFANQFVNVKMAIQTLVNTTLLPTAAIQRGAPGTFVYVVKEDKTVSVTPVSISVSQGELTAIDKSIPVGTMVVIEGADRLRAGAEVKILIRDALVSDSGEH